MSGDFLHGIEVKTFEVGGQPITLASASVVGLVGTGEKGEVNAPVLVTSEKQGFEAFGEGSIARALRDLFLQTRSAVVTVRAERDDDAAIVEGVKAFLEAESRLDVRPRILIAPEFSHKDAVRAELIATAERLRAMVIGDGPEPGATKTSTEDVVEALKDVSSSRIVVYDPWIEVSSPAVEGAKENLTARMNESAVIDSRIVILDGEVGSLESQIAGLGTKQKEKEAQLAALGEAPSGNRNRNRPSAEELEAKRETLKKDIESLTATLAAKQFELEKKKANGVKARGERDEAMGRVEAAQLSLEAVRRDVDRPPSAMAAGAWVLNDTRRGWWTSPSNIALNGIVGLRRPVRFALDDQHSDANRLNAAGIATIIRQNGFRLWGNRTKGVGPTEGYYSFITVRRVADIIDDSIQAAFVWALDRNISAELIFEILLPEVNAFIRGLQTRGAILGGSAWADPDLNTPSELKKGRIYLSYDFTAPFPAERITFHRYLTDKYISEIFK